MKVVINRCFGGFSLSPRAVKRLAELKGRPCFFFKKPIKDLIRGAYEPISLEQAYEEFMWFAFDVPNPNEVIPDDSNWREMTQEERTAHNALYSSHQLDSRPDDRADPDLVRVVEELGGEHREGASGTHAQLAVVEIPDGVEYVIDEYDGVEHIAETHRTWH